MSCCGSVRSDGPMPDAYSSQKTNRVPRVTNAWLWGVLAALACAALLLFPYTISGFLLTGDLRDVHLPAEAFYRRELSAGRIPLWDPLSALGFPVLASAQIGFWYPPLLALRVLPPEPAIALAVVVHVAFLALGMAVYGRSLGMSRVGASLSALAFAGSGFVIGRLTQVNILFGITWLPWALLCTDRLARKLQWRWLAWTSAMLALAALAGHFQMVFLMLALCGIRLFTELRSAQRSVPWQHTVWTWLLFLTPLVLLVILFSAAQLFPTLELVRESTRQMGGDFDIERANQHSFPPWQAITFLLPGFYGFPDLSEYWGKRPQIEMTAWVGVISLLLALIGAAGRRASGIFSGHETRGPNHESKPGSPKPEARGPGFWTITAVVGFLLALGRWSPLRLLGVEPTLGIFSGPARYLLLTQFSFAILAGFGLDRLQTASLRLTRCVGAISLAAATLTVGGFLVLNAFPGGVQRLGERAVDSLIVGRPEHVLSRRSYSEKVGYLLNRLSTWGVNLQNPSITLSVALFAGGGLGLFWIARSRRGNGEWYGWSPVLLGLTALELFTIAWRVHPYIPWRAVAQLSPVAEFVRNHRQQTAQSVSDGRLYIVHPQGDSGLVFASPTTTSRDAHERLLRDLTPANMFTRSGIPGTDWPAALDLEAALNVLNRLRDDHGRPQDAGILDRLGVRYLAVTSLTSGLRVQSQDKLLATFSSAGGTTIAVWERPTARPRVELLDRLPQDIGDPLPATIGTARITAETPQRVHVSVANPTDQPAALLLRDSLYPGWHATLDGVSTATLRADTLFRGVTIPPGKHAVTFTYRPTLARTGIITSGVAWTLVFGALFVRRAKRAVTATTGDTKNHMQVV